MTFLLSKPKAVVLTLFKCTTLLSLMMRETAEARFTKRSAKFKEAKLRGKFHWHLNPGNFRITIQYTVKKGMGRWSLQWGRCTNKKNTVQQGEGLFMGFWGHHWKNTNPLNNMLGDATKLYEELLDFQFQWPCTLAAHIWLWNLFVFY